MKTFAFIVQLALCALLGLALWRVVTDWNETALSVADEETLKGSKNGARPGARPGPSNGLDEERDPLFRQGVLSIPIARVRPRADSEWVPHATHFVVESLEGRKEACVSAVGTLLRAGEMFLRLETGTRPARSRLAAFAAQAGGVFHFEVLGRMDFRRLFPAGLVPCSEWVDRGDVPLAHRPGILRLRVGARRILASRSLTAVRVVRGNAIALARHPLRDAYEVSAEREGESVLSLTHLPGPHARTLRVVVTEARGATVASAARDLRERPLPAPPAPGHGRFLIPGWTSPDAWK